MEIGEVRLTAIRFSDGKMAYFEDPVMAEVVRSLLEKALGPHVRPKSKQREEEVK